MKTEEGKIELPEPGRYTRKAIDHPNCADGYGKASSTKSPRTDDPEAIDILIVEEASIKLDGRDVVGQIQSCNMDSARPYATSMVIFNKSGWVRDE